MPRIWTDEQRAAAAERIRKTRPWEKSTGPRTRAGKKRASRNARKHSQRSTESQRIRKALRLQNAFVELVQTFMAQDRLSCLPTNCKKLPAKTRI